MKQRELWENEAIVKDKVLIQAWLSRCMAVLNGRQPHTGAWYWKQTQWNEYTLVGGRETYKFSGYPMLHKFCVANNIDAIQA